jgi:hypothetical protein
MVMTTSIFLILLTLAIVALIDYIPRAFLVIKHKIDTPPQYNRVPRYVILPTVYGNISYLQNIAFLKRYADKVVICTSKYESEQFYTDLRAVCRKYGFRYIRADLPVVNGKPVKNAYTIYRGALSDLNRLGVRKDTPCLLMDADTYSHANVNNLIRAFIRHNVDIASLRCEVANPKTLIEVLQAYEYRVAMDTRRMDPWLTSGACSLGKASVLRHVFSHHSNFFAGGDTEIGKLGRVMGYKVEHITFTFFTAAPTTLKDWYKQRLIWFAGGFRHNVTNIASYGWQHFFVLFYNSLLVYLLLPLRWIEVLHFPIVIVALILLSWVYTAIIIVRKGWRPAYLLLPFYSFVQSMVIMPIAIGRYFKLAWGQRSIGLLKYEMSHLSLSTRALNSTLNITSAALVVFAAVAFTLVRWNYWAAI